MEQLIFFLLLVVGSIVTSILQKKKREEEEAAQRGEQPPPPAGKPPVTSWPRSARDWQEQLRRMLDENAPPPIEKRAPPTLPQRQPPAAARPIAVKVLPVQEKSEGDLRLKSPLRESAIAYQRAVNIHDQVTKRLRAVDQQTETHRPLIHARLSGRSSASFIRRIRNRPTALREAFVASLIFSPPKALEELP